MIRASIYGRLGGDPQERQTRNSAVMATVSLAVNVSRQDADEDVEWFDIVAFGHVGKVLLGHAKGDLLSAMGQLHRRRYTASDGTERQSWSLTAESILSARTVRPDGDRKRDTAEKLSAPATETPDDGPPFDDQIPF